MQVQEDAASLGITDITPCYVTAPLLSLAENAAPIAQPIGLGNGTLCSNPDQHLTWDQ